MLVTDIESCDWEYMDFAKPEYSKKQIIRAGKALREPIPANPDAIEEAVSTFKIAHNWRDSYVYPMRRVRAELQGKLRRGKYDAITAARLKRMASIVKKLRSTHFTLFQMQDIGGSRAILNNIGSVDQLAQQYLDGDSAHSYIRDDNYILEPKKGGYRSRHLVLKFHDPDGAEEYNRQFIEVQFRTRLQHAWATAVEAVGLVRDEDMKGGHGDVDWLRLFEIMAGEMAEREGQPSVPGVSVNQVERRKELVELDNKLSALSTLESYKKAIKDTENYFNISSPYYLIQYNTATKEVSIKPFSIPKAGSLEYQRIERDRKMNSVLVEVEKVGDLRAAYPNYFLDVGVFAAHLREATYGGASAQFKGQWWQLKNLLKR